MIKFFIKMGNFGCCSKNASSRQIHFLPETNKEPLNVESEQNFIQEMWAAFQSNTVKNRFVSIY